MKLRLRLLVTLTTLLFFTITATFGQATVTTDKGDYAPRSTAVFTGVGFKPYENVQLKVKNLFRACNTLTADSSYLPWTVQADSEGGFVTNWTVCDCDGDSLRLKATGLESGLIAYALFKDAVSLQSVSVGAQTGVVYYGAAPGSAGFVVTVNFNGSNSTASVALSYAINSPNAGLFGTPQSLHFSTNPVLSSNSSSKTSNLSINTSSTLPVGSYPFTVTGTEGNRTQTNTGNVVITKAISSVTNVSGSGEYGTSVLLTATVNINVAGLPVAFTLNGTAVGSANTNATGVATLSVPFASIPSAVKNATVYSTAVGASISGTTNYSAASGSGALTITTKSLTAPSTVANKNYNGSAATGVVSLGTVSGYVGSETLVITPTAFNYADANVGDGKATTISYALADGTNGGKASNYSMANISATGNIKPATLTAASTVADKNYNGQATTGAVTLGLVSGYIGSETLVIVPGASNYADANAADGKATTISYALADGTNGGKASNYSMSNLNTTGNIKPGTLTAASTIADKDYDGSASAGIVTLGFVSGYIGSETLVITPTAANFADANAADGKSTKISYSLADGTNGGKASNYTMLDLEVTGDINPKGLTAASTIADKDYDGATSTGIVTLGLVSGYIGSETLVITPTAANYTDANAADGKLTKISYLLADGTNGGKASNYTMLDLEVTGDINPKGLTAASTIADKDYDGATSTGIVTLGLVSGYIGSETLVITPTAANYADANAADGKSTKISYALADGTNGGKASNYTMADLEVTGDINPKGLTAVTTIADKDYDGQATTGVITLGSVTGYVGSETLLITPTAANYADANAADGKSTKISYSLADGTNGGKASNYTMADLEVTGDINQKGLSAASTIADKDYDGSAFTGTITLGLVSGYVGSETLLITPTAANYADANAADGKATTISYALADGTNGGKASNYTMADREVTGDINPKGLTAASTIADKDYDGQATTGVITLGSVTGYVGSETLLITPTTANYADASAADGKSTEISYALADGTNGGKASNYTMADLEVTGDINPKGLTAASTIADKDYDGQATTGVITLGLVTGYVGSETLIITPTAANYADANAADGKSTKISYSLADGTNGGKASNYTMADLEITGDINPKGLTAASTIADKDYDGSASTGTITLGLVSGYVGSETLVITPTAANYADANAADGKSTRISYALADGINGGKASNYTMADLEVTGDINPKGLTAASTIADKDYDGQATTGVITLGSVTGYVGSETLLITPTTANYADANAADGKSTKISYSLADGTNGGKASNYTMADLNATGDINPKGLTAASTIANKDYDGSASAGIVTLGLVSGYIGSETLVITPTAANYADANAGDGKSTKISYSLADGTNGGKASNYTMADLEVTGDINPKGLTAASTIADKDYDGQATTGVITLGSVTGYVGSETLIITPTAANYVDADAADGKSTRISYALADGINGGKASNYTMADLEVTGDINPKGLTAASTIADKDYDGQATTGVITLGSVTGYVGSETLIITPTTANYADANAADGKSTTISYALADGTNGGKASNYTMADLEVTGDINPKGLTAASTIADKDYDGSASAGIITLGLVSGYVGSETLVITPTAANYADANAADGKSTKISYALADGTNGGKASNYTMADLNATGDINPKMLSAASTISDKMYNASAAAGVVNLGIISGYIGSETLVITPTATDYSNANVGTGKTTTISYSLADGTNGGKAANYGMVNLVSSGIITARPLTITAVTNTKTYNGKLEAAAIPQITSGELQGNDAPQFTEVYLNKNAGTGKTLVPSGTVSDGNSGNNYSYQFVNNSTGQILTRAITVTAVASTKTYDGNKTSTAVPVVPALQFGDAIQTSPTEEYDNGFVGTGKTMTPAGLLINDGNGGNNYNITYTPASLGVINKAGSTTTLKLSGSIVRFMDNLTMTAIIKPLNTGSTLTGSVRFKIGGIDYGTANVVPIPGATDGSVQAMLIRQVNNLPASYTVEAAFTSSNTNYSNSSNTASLLVNPRDASPLAGKGFYTGDVFAWTTGPNSSTATITLVAALRDENTVAKGDVRGARISFFFINGGVSTPIAGAQNLPVGLVDVSDGSVGTASAVVQLNIGSLASASYQIGVKVTGAYVNNPNIASSQCILTVSKPIAGGFICGGGLVESINTNGYVKANANMPSSFQFDISYTKSGTNPKGKATIMIASYNKIDGTLDSKLHTYIITTNAISLLNVVPNSLGGAAGTFSAKANIVEQLENLSTVAIEGGAAFQMVAYQRCNDQQIAITLYRKSGGVWFSSNWSPTSANTALQALLSGKVYVDGGNFGCTRIAGSTSNASTAVDQTVTTGLNLNLVAAPNPSRSTFTLKAESDITTEAISLRIYNLNGHVVEMHKNLVSGQTITVGREYTPGVYFAELIQGSKRKMVKLMKIPY